MAIVMNIEAFFAGFLKEAGAKYRVDSSCIDCDLCREAAPDNFKRNSGSGIAYVSKQPFTPMEYKQCAAAKNACPASAIHN